MKSFGLALGVGFFLFCVAFGIGAAWYLLLPPWNEVVIAATILGGIGFICVFAAHITDDL